MRLSDAGSRCPQTDLIYPDHRHPPLFSKHQPCDRSNRLLDEARSWSLGLTFLNDVLVRLSFQLLSTRPHKWPITVGYRGERQVNRSLRAKAIAGKQDAK